MNYSTSGTWNCHFHGIVFLMHIKNSNKIQILQIFLQIFVLIFFDWNVIKIWTIKSTVWQTICPTIEQTFEIRWQ